MEHGIPNHRVKGAIRERKALRIAKHKPHTERQIAASGHADQIAHEIKGNQPRAVLRETRGVLTRAATQFQDCHAWRCANGRREQSGAPSDALLAG
jgi:hypothetical protein